MSVKTYSCIKTLNGGPGGIRCKCCNPYKVKARRMKAVSRRMARRIAKRELASNV